MNYNLLPVFSLYEDIFIYNIIIVERETAAEAASTWNEARHLPPREAARVKGA